MTYPSARYALFAHIAETHGIYLCESELDEIEFLAVAVARLRRARVTHGRKRRLPSPSPSLSKSLISDKPHGHK